MKSKIHSAGKGMGGLHLSSGKAATSFGVTKAPSRPTTRQAINRGNSGPKIVLGTGNQGSSSLRGK
jgi:hypothetical protein